MPGGREQRVSFLPLAIAVMQGDARCVAGLDMDTGGWVRPVPRGRRSMSADQAAQFKPDYLHELVLGGPQPRRSDEDPLGYHTEDRLLVEIARKSGPISPSAKLRILEDACDLDLASELKSGQRSLFAVRPETFAYEDRDKGARFRFSSTIAATRHTGDQWFRLPEQRIAIGPAGPKCTCPRWREFARARWPGWSVNEDLLQQTFPGARLYVVASLSALHEDYYYLIVAGVHAVHEEKTWL